MNTGIDMNSTFDNTGRTKLIEILESFLQGDEIYIIRILLSNTTLDIKLSSSISNPFDTNISSPQGGGLSECLFIKYLEKSPCTLRDQVDKNDVTGEHSCAVSFKSTLSNECICADVTDLINNSSGKKKRQLQLVTHTFAKFHLQINDIKTEHTVLKRGEKKNKEWRSTKKLSSLMGDQKDMRRRKQLSTTALHNLNNIWIRKNRIREHVRVKLYKTKVKPVPLYNSQK